MKKTKILFSLFASVFLLFGLCHAQGKSQGSRYPELKEWQGQVWITDSQGKRSVLRKRQVLKIKGEVETLPDAQVKIQLDQTRSFVLKGGSRILFPVIRSESGEVPVIQFQKGELQWREVSEQAAAYNVAVSSELFEFILPSGVYSLSIFPDRAFAGVKVFQGRFEFSALNGEESVTVETGKQASFQGILENGEISYDVLLKGKKIPRGQLSGVSVLTKTEMALVEKEEKEFRKKVEVQRKIEKANLKKATESGFICRDPQGRFNECAWVCVNNPKGEKKTCRLGEGASCVRRRCNGSGVWADEIVLGAEKSSNTCRAQMVVAPCDY